MKKIKSNIYLNSIIILILSLSLSPSQTSFENITQEKIILFQNTPLIYEHDDSSNITIFKILIRGGKYAETEIKKGLAYITTALMMEIPYLEKVRKIMNLGVTFFFQVEGDFSIITVKSLSENISEALKIILPIMKQPLFSSLRISNMKKYMKFQQKVEEDNSEQLMHVQTLRSLFKTTFYSNSIYGNKNTVKQIKKNDIIRFYKKHFNLTNLIIAISSNLKKNKILNIVNSHLMDIPESDLFHANPSEIKMPTRKTYFIKKDNKMTLISVVSLLPEISIKNYTMAYLMENMLGKGIGSKIWTIRTTHNLAYSLSAKIKQFRWAGYLSVVIKTKNDNAFKAMTILSKLLNELHEKGINSNEFAQAKNYAKSYILRSNETKDKRITNMLIYEASGLSYEFLSNFSAAIEKINLKEFNNYIKKILNPENQIKIIIGQTKIN